MAYEKNQVIWATLDQRMSVHAADDTLSSSFEAIVDGLLTPGIPGAWNGSKASANLSRKWMTE